MRGRFGLVGGQWSSGRALGASWTVGTVAIRDVKEWQSLAQNSNEMPLLRCVYYERDFYTRTAAKVLKTHQAELAVGKTLAAISP